MKLLLTSNGLTNPTIVEALEKLVGKSIGESRAVYVPTAMHAIPGGVEYAAAVQASALPSEWANFGILELTAISTLPTGLWMSSLEQADVIIVGGGNTPYLAHWFHRSGFSDLLLRLLEKAVYVGISAGSMVVSARLHVDPLRLERDGAYDDDLYGDIAPPGEGSDQTVRLFPFEVRPHFRSADFPAVTLKRVAATIDGPAYVLDDASAVVVDGPDISVASEGDWHYLP